ncbi:hypothetical protein LCGC14_2511600 [marine sediment metagenome]|uniref:Uncharacterized protein n=1 Tax=marine sediment metagenome TaxID=412755 RepID=A0A0F9AYZ6_9ZZZZ
MIACVICVVYRGITTRDLFETQEDLNEHLVAVHHFTITDDDSGIDLVDE